MSVYTKATLGWAGNQIKFNDYTISPAYRTQSRYATNFQVRNDDIPIPFESGTNDYETLIGSCNYIIKGTMYPKDSTSYYNGLAALRAACSVDLQRDDDNNLNNAYSGYVPYTWVESGTNKMLYVKALYVQVIEDTRQGYVQPFVIYCKVQDPIIYSETLKLASTQTSNPVTSTGAAKYAFTYPIVYGSTLYDVSSVATNIGNIPSYPVSIDIYGPITNPKINNSISGKFIQANVTLNSSTDVLHIEYNNSKLIATVNGNNVVQNITTSSNYFKIEPGSNIITLSGATIGTGAYAVLAYRDGYALA